MRGTTFLKRKRSELLQKHNAKNERGFKDAGCPLPPKTSDVSRRFVGTCAPAHFILSSA